MRALIIFISFAVLSFSLTESSHANPLADTLFIKANKLYQEGDYEKAVELYDKVDSLGLQSPELYFNTANAYFRSNKLGKARLYYERALILAPLDRDIKKNLSFLESLLSDRFEEVPELFLKTWMKAFFNLFHSDTWAIFSLIGFALFFTGGLVYIFVKAVTLRKTGFYAAIIFLLLSVSCFFISKYRFRTVNDPGTAIIMEGSQLVKSAPRQSGKDLFILHEGAKVWISNELDDWSEVLISDGRKGWVPRSAIEEI